MAATKTKRRNKRSYPKGTYVLTNKVDLGGFSVLKCSTGVERWFSFSEWDYYENHASWLVVPVEQAECAS